MSFWQSSGGFSAPHAFAAKVASRRATSSWIVLKRFLALSVGSFFKGGGTRMPTWRFGAGTRGRGTRIPTLRFGVGTMGPILTRLNRSLKQE